MSEDREWEKQRQKKEERDKWSKGNEEEVKRNREGRGIKKQREMTKRM
jgi:hypothetical protein